MYLAIDIGGTKTRVASLDAHGVIIETHKFPTPKIYPEFLRELAINVAKLSTKDFRYGCIGAPGKLDRNKGIAIAFGNLEWRDIPIADDIKKIAHCPIIIENDANLAGLSEAMLLKDQFKKVLYVTVSTGIGTGFIVNQHIDEAMQDSEGGHIMLEYRGAVVSWESFASGKAIFRRYHKKAQDITDESAWRHIASNIALGLIDLSVVMQPEVIVLGGGVSTYYNRFSGFLHEDLQHFATPLLSMPAIHQAQRPNEAVIYGCYDLAKAKSQNAKVH